VEDLTVMVFLKIHGTLTAIAVVVDDILNAIGDLDR
jgi:hypothetical protein